jgi:predicted phosphodiesterase
MIQGNTDLMIADYNEELYSNIKEKAPIMAEALKDDVQILNYIQKDFLKTLPIQLQVEVEGVKFLLVHGSPRKNNEDILPDTPFEVVEEMLVNVDADVVLCGHTHQPCGFQTTKKQTVVNVGSIGRPFTPEPKSCYLVITVKDGKCVFEHRFVEYEKEQAAENLRKRKFAGAEKLADMLIDPKQRHF